MNVAILGCGVVGSAVASLLLRSEERMAVRFGKRPRLKWILHRRSLSGTPLFSFEAESIDTILGDPSCELVVETIGGVEAAYEYSKQVLLAGKHLVTSNKELVATHGVELLALAKANACHYFYEASVGGGTPLVRSLGEDLAGNEITAIHGILNGTSNFILQEMDRDQQDFRTALAMAQSLGYAEHDPTDDVDGLDTARKLAILVSRVRGEYVPWRSIAVEGIRRIGPEQIRYAKARGMKIKLLALMADTHDHGLDLRVAPYLVSPKHSLYNVDGVYNALAVQGSEIGDCLYYGPGAGGQATASSVLCDIIQVLIRPFAALSAEIWRNNESIVATDGEHPVDAVLFASSERGRRILEQAKWPAAWGAELMQTEDGPVLSLSGASGVTEAELLRWQEENGLSEDLLVIRNLT